MTKRSKAPRTVETGAGWRIDYSRDDGYSAHINGVGLIGYAETKDAARDLIHDYSFGKGAR